MKKLAALFFLLVSFALQGQEREFLWTDWKMPDAQPYQIAAMTDESEAPGFQADTHRIPYLEWMPAPDPAVRKDVCMILISGGSYECCCDVGYIRMWTREFTRLGVQCVNFVYRTPRPEGIPFYRTAWEDGQRAVRLVRSQARQRGFDPEKIGVISMSAGSHLALLLGTSSQTKAYEPVDCLDSLSCHINWAIVNAPAYVTTDAAEGTPALREGYGADVGLSDIFRFDARTCPMSLHHGGADIYSPNGSTLVYRELRKRGVPAELHLYPNKGHGAFGFARGVEFMTQMGFLGPLQPEEVLDKRYGSEWDLTEAVREDLWPEGKMPSPQEGQCTPYLEWYIPARRTTDAIQIIYSGGAYYGNGPESFEVAPLRRLLNSMGVPVVTLKYRTPRPEGLAKHTTAWQDLQRCIRLVRSEAPGRGLDPDRIGIMGSSAGGHLTVLGVTSSRHRSYFPIDEIDELSCKVQWGIGIYPAYLLTDGLDEYNTTGGNDDSAVLAPEFSFDLDTAPMLLMHGDADGWAAMNSVKLWEKMRAMGVQCELHTLATREHCFQYAASPGTGSYNWMDRVVEFLTPLIGLQTPVRPLRLLVGTYTEGTPAEGVYLYSYNPATADTRLLSVAPSGNPSFVTASPDGKHVYSVNEYGDGRQGVSAYKLEGEKLTLLQSVALPQGGEDPCNLLFTGDALVTSNYSGGTVSAIPVGADGGIEAPVQHFGREAAHMHCAVLSPEGEYLFVADLGGDCIHRFERGSGGYPLGKETIAWQHKGKGQWGPRHMVFSADGRYAYLLCELGDKLVVFRYQDGTLTPIQTLTAYKGKGHGSADIHLSPDGRFLYTSHRLQQDGISIFSVDPVSGKVKSVGYRETGLHPRNFAISPDGRYLLCACRDSNRIEIYGIDQQSGLLTRMEEQIELGAPVCVQFLP